MTKYFVRLCTMAHYTAIVEAPTLEQAKDYVLNIELSDCMHEETQPDLYEMYEVEEDFGLPVLIAENQCTEYIDCLESE